VVLTGYSDESARQRAADLDAIFVLKPCLPDTLIAHIVQALDKAGRSKSGVDARTPDPSHGPVRRTINPPAKPR
jgi:hypothetical protein